MKTMWRSFFCSLNRSIIFLIKKIASVVGLLSMKPNWFVDICVVPRRRCSMTLSHNFSVAYQLNSLIISTTLDIYLVLVDWYHYDSSPLLRYLVRSKNIVEHLG